MSHSNYPWSGGEIRGYFYWQENYVGSSPATQYFANYVDAKQTGYEDPSNIVQATGTFNYSGKIPDASNFNAIFLFNQYSNATDVLNNLTNSTTNTDMYTEAKNYFAKKGITDFLLGLSFGGGYPDIGSWNTGSSGALYSIYEAVTQPGISFRYIESGTGEILTGKGTGKLNSSYNCLVFDIETWTGPSGFTAIDFINLFNYIKKNKNSMFRHEKICPLTIIVTIAHSCSNYNGTGQEVCGALYTSDSYDYIAPIMYTQNCGTTNEYCANENILWQEGNTAPYLFASLIQSNPNYKKFGMNFILPAIYLSCLYREGGANQGCSSNIYFYQESGNDTNPLLESPSGPAKIPYTKDLGVIGFFNSIFGTKAPHLGGFAKWVNGTLEVDGTTYR